MTTVLLAVVSINKVDSNELFFRLLPNKTLSFKGNSCNGGENSKGMITGLLACSDDETNQLPPLVTAAHKISTQQNSMVYTYPLIDYVKASDAKLSFQNTKRFYFLWTSMLFISRT